MMDACIRWHVDHTLGTILSHAMWSNPHVVVAQYAQKHPVQREEISIYCQTDTKISAVSGIEDAVHRTQKMLHAIDEEMMRALEEYSHAG